MRGTVDIKIRPIKLAFLVDPNRASQVREAIRLASSLWGGAYFPIIPLFKRMPASWREGPISPPASSNVVRGYIDAFDPDILVQFSESLPSYITDTRLTIVKPQEVWEGARALDEPPYGTGTFTLLDAIYKECFKYKSKYPTRVVVPVIPNKLGLFWAAVYGEYGDDILSSITSHYAEPLDIERPTVTAESFPVLTGPDVLFPRRITTWGLFNQGGFKFGQHACIFFLDASSVEDVVDYWNLRATGRNVLPLPKQFLQDESIKRVVIEFLVQERRQWPHDPKHFDVASLIRSRHSTMDEITAYAKTLEFPRENSNAANESYCSLQHWYPRIWDEWARSKDGGVVDVYAEGERSIDIASPSDLEMRIKPLMPEFLQRRWFHSYALCANEFDLRLFGAEEHLAEVYPKIKGDHLARAISGIGGLQGGWRIGRHGLVKLVQHSFIESRTVPSSETIFFAWLQDQGWEAELSPPGILAKQIFKRLGGNPRLLANKAVLGLLEHMNGGSVNRNGTPIAASRITAAREVSVGEVKSRLNNPMLYDMFLKRGVFKLGLQTQCPTCRRNTWFAMSALSESLECPKCLSSFPAAGHVDQSSGGWFYRTAGPFSVPNYADGAHAVLLTIDALSDRMHATFRTTSVPSFTATSPGKRDMEADFAMFWRDSLYGEQSDGILFGECKTYGQFEAKDIERMRELAETFPGAVLVFSTLREALTAKEIASIGKLAKFGRKHWKAERSINPVLILTGTELLDWKRPPECWSEEQRARFPRADGLLALCDATQQLYLNLPPLHQEWQRRWEQRRARRKTPRETE
ncbi:hypothetical protein [Burkholderia gladioli]|uniref:hypothetical protein n=1 Tax=Burkholderia gladioli TaxID=28095 RepID=UPI0016417F1C|nr:hypothetical protein [Burkholderia gladioli]MBJ9675436.1 hypothetical protein [Burkholderia gladioli]MDN7461492.1 hypothetical protein [Burkholderia gladioli]